MYYKVWFSKGEERTAGLVVAAEKFPIEETSVSKYSLLFPYSEARKMDRLHTSPVFYTWQEAFLYS